MINMNVEEPASGICVSNSITTAGWAVSDDEIAKIEVLLDNNFICNATNGFERPDVEQAFPGIKNSLYSGFRANLDCTGIIAGKHKLTIRFVDSCGSHKETDIIFFIKKGSTNLGLMVDNKSYITDLPAIKEGIIGGRNIRDGYCRGWGIQHNGLVEKVQNDKDFAKSYNDMAGRSLLVYEKIINIFLIIKFYLPNLIQGGERYSILEFGSYRGGAAIFMASLCKRLDLPIDIYGLDTFSGMPETNKTFDAHSEGDFKGANLEELIQYKESIGLNNLFFIKGLFSETAPKLLKKSREVLLTHIDCDIYEAVKYSYDIIQPKMIKGGYYIFDDATASSCIGATFAVEENVIRRDGRNSEQIYPHFVFRNL